MCIGTPLHRLEWQRVRLGFIAEVPGVLPAAEAFEERRIRRPNRVPPGLFNARLTIPVQLLRRDWGGKTPQVASLIRQSR